MASSKPAQADADEEYDVEYRTYDDVRLHVLARPDMYGGSKKLVTRDLRVLGESGVVTMPVTATPISCRCFFEGLDNFRDAATVARERNLPLGRHEVTLSPRRISILNESAYIPIKKQLTEMPDGTTKDEGWKPFICLGKMRTSSNYDDDGKRTVVGRNGVGGHLIPIESTVCELEVLDPSRRLRYTQRWLDNAAVVEEPIVERWTIFPMSEEDVPRRCGSVRVTWVLSDAAGVEEYSADVLSLFKKGVADASFTANLPIAVVEYPEGDEEGWRGPREETMYDLRGESYFSLYPKLEGCRRCSIEYEGSRVSFFDTPGAAFSEAFANGGHTPQGGVHVRVWRLWLYRQLHAIAKVKLGDKLIGAPKKEGGAPSTKKKPAEPTEKALEKLYGPHVALILACTLVEPAFTSQTKEELSSPTPRVPPLDATLAQSPLLAHSPLGANLDDWRVFAEVEAALEAKARRKGAKDNGKRVEFVDVENAEDAEWAGTRHSGQCSLILCEGDSGKTTAIKGAMMVNPRAFGVYPVEGVPANLIQHPLQSAEVVRDLKKLLGWAPGKTRKQLRYDKLQIMTDADPDGVHIRLLLIVMMYVAFPGLVEDGFVEAFIFPIVTAEKRGKKFAFYTMQEYEHWASENNNGRGWTLRYFKGLGSCTDPDIHYTFTHPLIVRYAFDALARDALRLAFEKGQEDERKLWLEQYDPTEHFRYPGVLEISASVLKELPIFSIYETQRCIPSLMDGLNLGQRKVVHVVRKNAIDKPIKTAQLAGQVANEAAYHHNEDTLQKTITRMNQTYAGSNNLPLLTRSGEFGSRRKNGKDASEGRYTYTYASPVMRTIFTPEDDLLLVPNLDGDKAIEPRYFYSIVALVLANWQEGIGTGSNCKIPCHDPRQLVRRHRLICERVATLRNLGPEENLLGVVDEAPPPRLIPWARWYRGSITLEAGPRGTTRVVDRGVFSQRAGVIQVTEVPLSVSYEDYRDKLEEMKTGKKRKKKGNKHVVELVASKEKILKSHKHPAYDLHENGDDRCCFELQEFGLMPTHRNLKLESVLSTSQMTVWDEKGKLRHFASAEHLLEHYSGVMLESRETLRLALAERSRQRVTELELKVAFVVEVIAEPTLVAGQKDEPLRAWMEYRGYPRHFLDMRLASITDSLHAKIVTELAAEKLLLLHYEALTPEALWLEQLTAFEAVYARLYPDG
jgi:DNA topoisomerase-2